MREDCVTECFADDAMVYAVGESVPEAVASLNGALDDAAEWIRQSDLVLNYEKCTAMIMSSQASRLVVERHATPVRLGDQSLTRQDCTKYLGVLVDRHLQ